MILEIGFILKWLEFSYMDAWTPFLFQILLLNEYKNYKLNNDICIKSIGHWNISSLSWIICIFFFLFFTFLQIMLDIEYVFTYFAFGYLNEHMNTNFLRGVVNIIPIMNNIAYVEWVLKIMLVFLWNWTTDLRCLENKTQNQQLLLF